MCPADHRQEAENIAFIHTVIKQLHFYTINRHNDQTVVLLHSQ